MPFPRSDTPAAQAAANPDRASTPLAASNPRRALVTAESVPALSRRHFKVSPKTHPRLTRRTFIYTRYSTAEQLEKSEERQIADCRASASKTNLDVVDVFSDRGLTGTAMAARPALQRMLGAARRRECDVIKVEDLDRLSRSMPDIMAIFYELRQLGIELHDIATGKLDLIHVVMRGYLGEEGRVRFLAMLKAGKLNAVRNGFMMGRVHYGYRRDPDQTGVHVVDPVTAETLVWIYRTIADGMTAGAVARDLNRRGILPPAQAHALARGEEPIAGKLWRPQTILKLVQSHTPLGLISWGKTVPVHDPKTRRRTGSEATEEATWTIVAHPELRLVDDETWTRANLRLSALAYTGAASGRRFLLSGKACCVCGATLEVQASESATRWVCGRHRHSPGACDVADNHRLDWVERAVVSAVMTSVLDPSRLDGHVAAVEAEIAGVFRAEFRRRGDIERRLEKIHGLVKASFVKEEAGTLHPKRAGTIRMELENEAAGLEAELDGLRDPFQFKAAVGALGGVEGDLGRMLDECPFRPEDPEGVAMAQAVRDVVDRVTVYPCDGNGFTRVEVHIDFLQHLRDGAGVADGGRLTLETGFRPDDLRTAEREARLSDGAAGLEAAAADHRHDLTDAEWDAIAHLVRAVDFAKGAAIDPRAVVNGMFCLAKEGGAIGRIPARYGDKDVFRRAVKRLVYCNRWDEAVAVLRADGAACLVGARLERYDTTEFLRRNEGVRPDPAKAARDRRVLLSMAGAEPEGHPVALRCTLVAMVLGGAPVARSAKALGISASSAYHHWDNYKDGGVEVLAKKTPFGKATALDQQQIDELKALAMTGLDPDDAEAWITYPILCRVCRERFGIGYSVGGMTILATREGFPLRPLVAKARRERNLLVDLPPPAKGTPRSNIAPIRRPAPASKNERRKLQEASRSVARGGDRGGAG